MFLAFSFTELGAIPDAWRTWIVVVAAFGTAFGSSFGSVGSSVVIYAKAFEKRVELLDWISLALSILATMGGFILGFAALLAGEEWAAFVRIWGPIALSILVGGDAAGDLIELGGRAEREPTELVFDPSWPTMSKEEFLGHLERLNGDRATLADPETLKKFIHSKDRNLPSRTTLKRFRTLAEKE
jgi:MFS family permease